MVGKLAVIIILLSVALYFARNYFNGPMCSSRARIDGKTVLITGSNTGIGKETARDLVSRGGRVIMACRSLDKCKRAAQEIQDSEGVDNSAIYYMKLDLASFKSIREFATEFDKNERKLDILINNGGVMATPYMKTEDGLEIQTGTNHFGHFLLTNLLLDKLKSSAPSRIVTVSSRAHKRHGMNFADINWDGENPAGYSGLSESMLAYGQSKTANILFSQHLANILKGTGVTTYSLHPGAIATDLGRHMISNQYLNIALQYTIGVVFKDIVHGAQTTICCAVDESLASQSGKYYADCAESTPAPHATDEEAAQKLWDLSLQITGLDKKQQSTQT